ncbi:HNH endonuclease [Spirosoma panaciterrae]|uniref:HNH endonuclease n=1 Tax=Spirosoma panaciterrae TaxID=496058 RepID=UPI00036EE5B3|nr:HNH endonuclease signature motif containing protein [Spirosoma panaciterrae]
MPTIHRTPRYWEKKSQKKASRWSNEEQGGVPNQFYRNAPWRNLRKAKLEKDPLCEECLKKKRLVPATVVDHVNPIRLGGAPLDIDNTRSLCKSCHARKSAKERHIPTPSLH